VASVDHARRFRIAAAAGSLPPPVELQEAASGAPEAAAVDAAEEADEEEEGLRDAAVQTDGEAGDGALLDAELAMLRQAPPALAKLVARVVAAGPGDVQQRLFQLLSPPAAPSPSPPPAPAPAAP